MGKVGSSSLRFSDKIVVIVILNSQNKNKSFYSKDYSERSLVSIILIKNKTRKPTLLVF